MEQDQYLSLFIAESREYLQKMSQKILHLAENPSAELYQELLRLAHSVKGMASTLGAETLKQISHALEGLLGDLKSGSVDQESVAILLAAVDAMQSIIDEMEESGKVLNSTESSHDIITAIRQRQLLSGSSRITNFRVETKAIDRLVDGLGELLILNTQLEENGPTQTDIIRLQRLSRNLYEIATDLRMLPFEVLSSNFSRFVFDLSARLNKKVRLEVQGATIRMDKSILEELADPLIHLLRNAVDHGIEADEIRVLRGKNINGTIILSVERAGDRILISVEDDGAGIHVETVKQIAIRNGWTSEQTIALMNEQEIFLLMTKPGFTTASAPSEISGRGIGLDVLRTKVETLGGALTIRSTPGLFTRFEIQVPLTLAVLPAILVRAGSRVYAVPLSRIDRFVLIRKKNLIFAQGRPFVVNGDQMLYVSDLNAALCGESEDWPDEFSAFVTHHQNRRIAWSVEELICEQDILVRSMGEPMCSLSGYSGAAVLSNGDLVPVLDVQELYSERYC
jgi:two-component system chemotaxis sensor kinase CheA